jgi:hypothetical protein
MPATLDLSILCTVTLKVVLLRMSLVQSKSLENKADSLVRSGAYQESCPLVVML